MAAVAAAVAAVAWRGGGNDWVIHAFSFLSGVKNVVYAPNLRLVSAHSGHTNSHTCCAALRCALLCSALRVAVLAELHCTLLWCAVLDCTSVYSFLH